MNYQVEMLFGHGPGVFREVQIEDQEVANLPTNHLLEQIFYHGQNDFQPIPGRCSVSVGDVVHLQTGKHMVMGAGFKELTDEQYKMALTIPSYNIVMYAWALEKEAAAK